MATSGWGTIPWGQGPWGFGEDDPDAIVTLPWISKESAAAYGSIVRFWLDVVVDGVGIAGAAATIAIRRNSDGLWLNTTESSWGTLDEAILMAEADPANLPGRYYFDFDTSLYVEAGSREYLARSYSFDPRVACFEHLTIGPFAARVEPSVCLIQGTILDEDANPSRDVEVFGSLVPVQTLDGMGYEGWEPAVVHTDDSGFFSLPLIRAATYRIEIPSIRYDKVVVVPDADQVSFIDL